MNGGGRYSIIPARAVYDQRLKPVDLHVLNAIGHHTDQNGWCFFNQSSLAKAINSARQTVNVSISRLTKTGYLEHRDINAHKPGAKLKSIHIYRVLMDDKSEPSAELLSEIEKSSEMAEIQMSPADDNRCHLQTTTVVTSGRQLNDPLITTPLERREPNAQKTHSADRHQSKKEKGKKQREMNLTQTEDQENASADMQATRDLDQADFAQFQKVAEDCGLNVPQNLTPGRREQLRDLRRAFGPAAWGKAMAIIRETPFLAGKNSAGWAVTFRKMMDHEFFARLIEGEFGDRKKPAGGARGPASGPTPSELAAVPRYVWQNRLNVLNEKGVWSPKWGPRPGQPYCGVPEDMVAEGVKDAA